MKLHHMIATSVPNATPKQSIRLYVTLKSPWSCILWSRSWYHWKALKEEECIGFDLHRLDLQCESYGFFNYFWFKQIRKSLLLLFWLWQQHRAHYCSEFEANSAVAAAATPSQSRPCFGWGFNLLSCCNSIHPCNERNFFRLGQESINNKSQDLHARRMGGITLHDRGSSWPHNVVSLSQLITKNMPPDRIESPLSLSQRCSC